MGARQIDPQLQAVHRRSGGWILLVDDSPAGGHPLHVAGTELAVAGVAVVVFQLAADHVSNRLDPAMGVFLEGAALKNVFHQQQKGIVFFPFSRFQDRPAAVGGTVDGQFNGPDPANAAQDRHVFSLLRIFLKGSGTATAAAASAASTASSRKYRTGGTNRYGGECEGSGGLHGIA